LVGVGEFWVRGGGGGVQVGGGIRRMLGRGGQSWVGGEGGGVQIG